MATNMNIHTGDKMMTKPPSKAYADGWDRVFVKTNRMLTVDEFKQDLKEICDMKKSPKKAPGKKPGKKC